MLDHKDEPKEKITNNIIETDIRIENENSL